nr:MAG TPA: Site specific DNA methylase [Caudoviricetes sp.]
MSWLRSPLTFSRNRYLGLSIEANLAISKKRVPLVSSNPLRCPAMLKAWHGKPPQIASTCPMFLISSSVTV